MNRNPEMLDIKAMDHLLGDLVSNRSIQDRKDRRVYRAIQATEEVGALATVVGAAATVIFGLKENNSEAVLTGVATLSSAGGTGALELLRRTLRNINPNVAKPRSVKGLRPF